MGPDCLLRIPGQYWTSVASTEIEVFTNMEEK